MASYQSQIEESSSQLDSLEQMLGKGLNQPFNYANSGARKLLSSIQYEQSLNLIESEPPIIGTGYENRYGDYSSSIKTLPENSRVLAKVVKFSDKPDHHYYLIVHRLESNSLDIIERKSYNHNTESYGYLYNNSVIDSLNTKDIIKKNEVIRSSLSYDSSGNRCDGTNLNTIYTAKNKNTEDGIQVSKSAIYKLRSTLIKTVVCNINDNDIVLNLYGDDDHYKSFPDIREDINNGILLGVRREKIEDSLFMQSKDRLKNILMSDEKYTLSGKVIDIDIKCNTPENLSKYTNTQLKYYYDEKQRFIRELVDIVDKYKSELGITKLQYDLEVLYSKSKQEIDGVQYVDNRNYSGTIIYFTILSISIPEVGDKLSNRYGGKGVISEILDDHMLPLMDNGEYAELVFNSYTCINRENEGQLIELSLSHIQSKIIEYISTHVMTYFNVIGMILEYIRLCSPTQADALKNVLDSMNKEECYSFIDSILEEGRILLSIKPMSEPITLDTLAEIYRHFPWVKQNEAITPMKGSDGKYRYVPCRRRLVCGKTYIYRLKQYAEEKFSATSLSSTNIRNENSRSKANKNFKALHQNTPIRFGDMEHGDYSHMGTELVKSIMMLYSSSPHARLLIQKLYVDNPYEVNIQLDEDSTDRSAEIFDVYFKTCGLRLHFKKVRKQLKHPVSLHPVSINNNYVKPVMIVSKEEKGFDINKHIERDKEVTENFNNRPVHFEPISIYDGNDYDKEKEIYHNQMVEGLAKDGIDYYKDK